MSLAYLDLFSGLYKSKPRAVLLIMAAAKKRRSSSGECTSPVFMGDVDRALGTTFCTPRGIGIVSEPLYVEYIVPESDKTQRFRQLVHCQGNEWWLQRKALTCLGLSRGWMYTDSPPLQWSHDVYNRVLDPVIFPFLHRKDSIIDLRQLRYCLTRATDDPAKLIQCVLDEAEKTFGISLKRHALKFDLNYTDPSADFSCIDMCHSKSQRTMCSACGRIHLIVCTFKDQCLCNKCARHLHANLKLCEKIPRCVHDRNTEACFSALVDCCLTIEENFRTDPTRVLDYSQTTGGV